MGDRFEPAVGEDSLQNLLIPEVLTPEQQTDRTRAELVDNPFARLMLAVLEDAIATYKRYAAAGPDRRSRRLFEEVDAWLRSTDEEPLYSFERICAILDFDAVYMRQGLADWRRSYLASGIRSRPASFRRMNARRLTIGRRDRSVAA